MLIIFRNAKFILTLLGFSFLMSSCDNKISSKSSKDMIERIIPSTVQPVEPITAFTPLRISHLTQLVIALEKYKQDHHQYPISSDYLREWDRLFNEAGDMNAAWINGLVPEYLPVLPRDPRENNIYNHQYAYKSNGAHYKLLSLYPDDCSFIKIKAPYFIDPKRDCLVYGFWTHGAADW